MKSFTIYFFAILMIVPLAASAQSFGGGAKGATAKLREKQIEAMRVRQAMQNAGQGDEIADSASETSHKYRTECDQCNQDSTQQNANLLENRAVANKTVAQMLGSAGDAQQTEGGR